MAKKFLLPQKGQQVTTTQNRRADLLLKSYPNPKLDETTFRNKAIIVLQWKSYFLIGGL